ncbi:thialysine N-epsilon-acetyltransferase [Patella vulgata]|uniref:thialysine N-epsilon-acetyltransferase n=1 Tax=Patella vulgata TaxID=6465 RepID=UPI0024A8691C|nr:thialysine N-epsilon-acetyltransferase [Patella vulgata]
MAVFRIRDAVIDDCEEIFRMCKDQALLHGWAHEIISSVDTLRKDGFGEKPLFGCLVAEKIDSGKAIAYTMFSPFYVSWMGKCMLMSDLHVTETERGKGVGRALVNRLAQVSLQEGCVRLQWDAMGWNDKAIKFYNKIGGTDTTIADGGRRIFIMNKPEMEKCTSDNIKFKD